MIESGSPPAPGNGAIASAPRLAAIDALRGLAMVLMTIDHASSTFNAGRLSRDSAAFVVGTPLPPAQFLTRFVTHVCAPTFLLLAGASVALQLSRRPAREIDRDLALRGILLIAIEVCWMSWAWSLRLRPLHLDVLYATGASMIALIALRRLGARGAALIGVALAVGHEALAAMAPRDGVGGALRTLLLSGGDIGPANVLYPVLPWLAVMLLGFGMGPMLTRSREAWASRRLVAVSVALFVGFLLVRGAAGYGDAGLHRQGRGLIEWLHVSKYPPSLSFLCLEGAITAVLLALLLRLRRPPPFLVLFGQTALFFYLLHVHLLKLPAFALGVNRRLGLAATYAAAIAVLLLLHPVCRAYRRLKLRHPNGPLRLL